MVQSSSIKALSIWAPASVADLASTLSSFEMILHLDSGERGGDRYPLGKDNLLVTRDMLGSCVLEMGLDL